MKATTHVVLVTLFAMSFVSGTASTRADSRHANGLDEDVRRATRAFHDPANARAVGYVPSSAAPGAGQRR